MNLKNLSDEALHSGTLEVVREEREILTRVLHHLRETERRRLFSKFRCSTLHDYAVAHLNYSDEQAGRRIKAMCLLRDTPEIEEKINSGALNLTNLALAQKLFFREKKAGRARDKKERIEVLQQLEHQTTRAAEKIVFAINPSMKPKKQALEFHNIEDEALREKLLQVKGLFAHSDPHLDLTALLHKLCDNELAKKTKTVAPRVNSQAEIKRQVWRREGGKCRNCSSTHAVQIEHVIPQAVGGPSTLENMCLLCRSCNQRSAIEYFGMEKMEEYLRSPIYHYGTA